MKSSNQYVIREFVFITIIAEGLYTYQQVNVYLKSIQRFIYLVRPREFFFFFFFLVTLQQRSRYLYREIIFSRLD